MGNDSYQSRRIPAERTLSIRGIEHRLYEWGESGDPPVLLLHGWGDTGATFQFLVDALQGEPYLVAPDWRGFGDSGHNASAYWFPDYLADLDALLDHYSPAAPVVLIGHSMGGNVAALYAGIRPERVAALVNVEGFGLPDSDPADAPAHYRRWLAACRERREHPGYAHIDELLAKIRGASPRITDARARFVARCWTRPGTRWHLKADMAHRWPNAVMYRRAEARACWCAVRAPTLLVYGEETAFTEGVDAWRDETRRPVSGAEVAAIPAAGHMLHFEQPAALAAAIGDFLRRHGPYL